MIEYQALLRSNPTEARRFYDENKNNEKFSKVVDLHNRIVPMFKEAMNKRADSINAALEETDEVRKPMLDSILEDVKDEIKKQLSPDDARRVKIQDFRINRGGS